MKKKKGGNVGFKDLDTNMIKIADNQGSKFDYPWARGKNNVNKKGGVEAF